MAGGLDMKTHTQPLTGVCAWTSAAHTHTHTHFLIPSIGGQVTWVGSWTPLWSFGLWDSSMMQERRGSVSQGIRKEGRKDGDRGARLGKTNKGWREGGKVGRKRDIRNHGLREEKKRVMEKRIWRKWCRNDERRKDSYKRKEENMYRGWNGKVETGGKRKKARREREITRKRQERNKKVTYRWCFLLHFRSSWLEDGKSCGKWKRRREREREREGVSLGHSSFKEKKDSEKS